MAKSSVVGINLESDCIDRIAAEVGCVRGSWPLNYLGMPLGGNPNSLAFWDPVIERVSRKLEGWHKGGLSRGGRLTLLQAVLGSMPVYLMSVFRMPCKVIEAIEAMMRNFFWEGRGEHKRDHLVRWDIVSLPKKCGGLGVGNLKLKNMALLGKWLWRFPLESKSLWHSIILSKFGNHSNGWDVNTLFNATLRSPWKSIARIWEKYMENIKLVLGRGDRIRFWEDVWVESSSLRDRFPRLYRLSLSQNAVISSVLKRQSSTGFSWDLNFSRNFNNRDIVDFTSLLGIIGNTHFNFNSGDKRVWVGTSSGKFSCKSFLENISCSSSSLPFPQYSFIWKGGVPHKVKVFAWLASLGKVNTCDKIQVRRPNCMLSPSVCILCKKDGESIDHILVHCSVARFMWSNLFSLFGVDGVLPKKWADCVVIKWSFGTDHTKAKILWRILVLAMAWRLWLERNSRIFDDKVSGAEEIWDNIIFSADLWARAFNIIDSTQSFLFKLDCFSFLDQSASL
ncbi:hypothetical protein LguiA_001882 [Lonicera macranthoides]